MTSGSTTAIWLSRDEREFLDARAQATGTSRSGALHVIVRLFRRELLPGVSATADKSLRNLMVEWSFIAEAHRLGCRDPDCRLCDLWGGFYRREGIDIRIRKESR